MEEDKHKKAKKRVYIFASAVFGLLLSFMVHAGLEIIAINLLISDFDKYSFGLTWEQLFAIHYILSVVLAIAGVIFGLWIGFRWHRLIYEENRGGLIKNIMKN